MKYTTSTRTVRQRGVTLPLVALFIVALFTVAALAIDIGVLLTARTSAQHAADSAALAGAYTFLNPVAVEPTDAINAAVTIAAKNNILGTPVAITAGNVAVDVLNRRVTVTVPRTGANGVTTYFARAMGIVRKDVIAVATAEASKTGTGSKCLKPIFIPTTIASALQPSAACKAGQVLLDSSGNLTAYGKAQMGSQWTIRPTDPQNALNPGEFYSLDFGSGAQTYRCTLGQCLNDCNVNTQTVSCGQQYPIETGDMVGPTKQGVDDLIGKPSDTWITIGQYQTPNGVSSTSRSLAVAPVWDDCTQVISPGYKGQKVKVLGFVEIFIDGMNGKNLKAHLVQPIACPSGGAGGAGGGAGATGANTGPFAIPVRLVQTP